MLFRIVQSPDTPWTVPQQLKRRPQSAGRLSAFTLLEVVVGLTLMATVLVGSMLSFAAHHRQRRVALAKIEAVAIADELLNQLTTGRDGIPIAARGAVPGKPNWYWQTSFVGTAQPASVPLSVVRLDIVSVGADGTNLPLAGVEVVKPIPLGPDHPLSRRQPTAADQP